MMRPIDELMAYYAARQIKTRGVRKPRLSPEAQELRVEFEVLMDSLMSLSRLVEHFADRFAVADITKLYELFPKADFQVMKNNDLMKSPINDLLFEEQVAHFTRMQERERMRKRFKELEEKEHVFASDEMDSKHENIPHLAQGEKTDWPVFLQVVFGMLLFFLLMMILKFLLGI
ncbi:hypothetical protein [Aquirufa sp. TARAVU-A1A]